jgi:hypothetical protein
MQTQSYDDTRWSLLLGSERLPENLQALLEELGLPGDFFKFSIWYTAIDSTDDPQREQLRKLLMNPVAHLHPEGEHGTEGLALPPLAATPPEEVRVVTTINNHHKRLNPRIVFISALVDDESSTVHLGVQKQNQ